VKALQHGIEEGRRRIAMGERPTYQAITAYDGFAIDVRVRELPIIHIFVADETGVLDAARGIIAEALQVDRFAFDVQPEDLSSLRRTRDTARG